jgi:hypothetical protein
LFSLAVSPGAAAESVHPPNAARAEAYYHFSLGLQERCPENVDAALAEYRKAQKLDPATSTIRVETRACSARWAGSTKRRRRRRPRSRSTATIPTRT